MKRKVMKDDILLGTKEIMRKAKEERGITQKELADRLGILQTSLSAGFAREHISLTLFSKYMNGMGYAVAVVDKQSGDVRWVVDPEE